MVDGNYSESAIWSYDALTKELSRTSFHFLPVLPFAMHSFVVLESTDVSIFFLHTAQWINADGSMPDTVIAYDVRAVCFNASVTPTNSWYLTTLSPLIEQIILRRKHLTMERTRLLRVCCRACSLSSVVQLHLLIFTHDNSTSTLISSLPRTLNAF